MQDALRDTKACVEKCGFRLIGKEIMKFRGIVIKLGVLHVDGKIMLIVEFCKLIHFMKSKIKMMILLLRK